MIFYGVDQNMNGKKMGVWICFSDLKKKTYSLILNRGCSENLENLNFFAFFRSSLLRSTFPPKKLGCNHFSIKREIFQQKVSSTRLYSTQQSMGAMKHTKSCTTWKCKIGINWNVGNMLFVFISSDSCNKMMLLESLNTPKVCVGGAENFSWFFICIHPSHKYNVNLKKRLLLCCVKVEHLTFQMQYDIVSRV